MTGPTPQQDWTTGPAKWAAVIVLGTASLAGMAWSIFFREPVPIVAPRPQPVALATIPTPGPAATPVPAAPAPVPAAQLPVVPQPPAQPPTSPAQSTQAPAAAPQPEVQSPPASTAVPSAAPPPRPARINLNTATAAELELLPGIGPVVAARIIDHRTKNGPFKTITALDAVKGIGPKTIESLRPLVTVE